MKKRPKTSNAASPGRVHAQGEPPGGADSADAAGKGAEMQAKLDFEILQQALVPLPSSALPAMLLAHATASTHREFEDVARQLLAKQGLGHVERKDVQFVYGKIREYAGGFLMHLPELASPTVMLEPVVSHCQTCHEFLFTFLQLAWALARFHSIPAALALFNVFQM